MFIFFDSSYLSVLVFKSRCHLLRACYGSATFEAGIIFSFDDELKTLRSSIIRTGANERTKI